jgi:hypothetical protein
MALQRPKPEEIVLKSWQVKGLMGQGMPGLMLSDRSA